MTSFQALIGKSTSKETVFKVDLFAQFIDPFLSFSEKSLAFTILKVSSTIAIARDQITEICISKSVVLHLFI